MRDRDSVSAAGREPELALGPPTGQTAGTFQLQALFAGGRPDAQAVARVLMAHPAEQYALATWLHGVAGNFYVQSVVEILHAWSPPIRLDPNAAPPPPTTTVPLASGEDLEARAKKSLAQDLLVATSDTGENARKAVEILLEIAPAKRGKLIDELDDKAFANLLERVPDADRERFAQLLAGTQRPERKLKLWAAAHTARAQNDLARHKGDAGRDAPLHQDRDEDTDAITWDVDEDEKAAIEATYTPAQRLNRRRHERRESAVETTKDEVELEVSRLLAKSKQGTLTLADVDAMAERKDLEYQIELENNLSLTAHGVHHDEPVVWAKSELESLRMSLARLPQIRSPEAVEVIDRQPFHSTWVDGIGGVTHAGRDITIYDWGATTGPGFRHGGDDRELVSDEFKRQHGDTIGAQEFVVTHEVGHDVAHHEKRAFEAMTKAAGWKKVKVAQLREDAVIEDDIKRLDRRRTNPNEGGGVDISGTHYTYAPIADSDEYWALPKTAVPQAGEATPSVNDDDTWLYARVNPDECFAEIYAKAVHVPEKLHDELIDRPTAAASRAQRDVAALQQQVDDLLGATTARNEPKLAVLRKSLADAKQVAIQREIARTQRAEEFRIMREDVFHTDKALALARDRLRARHVAPPKLEAFERRAATASTPEQIAFLESQATR